MGITATQIREVGFEHALRGYDMSQVDEFLDQCASGVEELAARIAELEGGSVADPEDTAEIPVAEGAQDAHDEQPAESAELAKLKEQLAAKDAKIAKLEAQLAEKVDSERVISEAFISAQRSAEQLKEEARQEGVRIYNESENKARELIRGALVSKQRVLNEVEVLEASRNAFRTSYLDMLNEFKTAAEDKFEHMADPQVSDEDVERLLAARERTTQSAIPDPKEASAEKQDDKGGLASIDFDPLPTAEMERVKFNGDISSPLDDIEEYF